MYRLVWPLVHMRKLFFLFINLGNVCQCDPWGAHEGQSATDGGVSQLAGEEFYHREDGPHPTGTPNTHVPTVSHCPYRESLSLPWVTVPTVSHCSYRESLSLPWVNVPIVSHCPYRESLSLPWVTVPTVSHCSYRELLAPPVETKPLLWGFYFHLTVK